MFTKYSAIVIAVFGFGIQNATAGNEQAQRITETSNCYHPLNGQTYAPCPLPSAKAAALQQAASYVPLQYYKIRYLGEGETQLNDQYNPAKRD